MSIVVFQTKLVTKSVYLFIEKDLVIVLSVTVGVFLILLFFGVRNTYKLKAENERLANLNNLDSDENTKEYKDFTEGHLYNKN